MGSDAGMTGLLMGASDISSALMASRDPRVRIAEERRRRKAKARRKRAQRRGQGRG